ncbi:unnamed protein product [Closterium sp. Yama58-4]|nr:unnamed protein product [Closterium sp. Yama58-4]
MPRPLSPHPTPPVGLAALRSAAPPALHSAAPAALHSAAAAALHSAALAALGSAAPAALHSAAAADLLFAAAAALRSAAPAAFRSAAAAALPSAAVAAALRSAAAAALPSAAVAVCHTTATLPSCYCHIHRPNTLGHRPTISHQHRRPITVCQVSLVDDGPFVAAIATSIALSAAPLVLPSLPFLSQKTKGSDDDDAAAAAAAALLAAGCWVLAWIDSRDVKYILFAAVYAAPYARGGLTLAVDGNWLPLFSIAACALHVQVDNVAVERRKLASKIKCAKKKGSLHGNSKDKGSNAKQSK